MEKLPVFWIALLAMLVAGIAALAVAVITEQAFLGFIVLVVLAMAAAWFVMNTTRARVKKLTHLTREIDQAVQQHNAFMQVDRLIDQVAADYELSPMAQHLRSTLHTLDRHINQINSLYTISQTITSSTLDYEKTVKAVLAAVQKVVDYDAAEVSVLRDNLLYVEAWWGKDGFVDTTGRSYKIGSGPTGSIAETKKVLYLPEITEEVSDLKRTIGYASMNTELIMKTTKLVINSFLGIPLIVEDRLIGTLTLVHHQKNYFTPDDKQQLATLTEQASIAIDNALKIREREHYLQRQISELRGAIDDEQRTSQVKEITESDYFQQLRTNAASMRRRAADLSDPDDTKAAD